MVGGQRRALVALPPGTPAVPIVWENGWAPGQNWTGAGNFTPTGIRFSDRPARSSRYTDFAVTAQLSLVQVKQSRYRPGVTQRVPES
jgi:hypothetical protein